ncbi:hypothetical protein LCGC14_1826660 [marine sediment metagenome]|uniref:Glycosyltransferase 2-like domain-containing protein n=1 Tax=marine sediment metagenome TaxID=412755 RepID=A0A0F9GHK4_9ZZZZ
MIAVLVTTYVPPGGQLRIEAVRRAVESWKAHLGVPGEVHVHVSDDGSAPDLDFGESFWRRLLGDWATLSYSQQQQGGLGASLNTGLAVCTKISPFVLYPMDDWELACDLDLQPWMNLLTQHPEIGCIRMGQPSGSVRGGRGRRFGQQVGVSFERYAFYWSLVPALYHERFFYAYGPFMEAASPAKTEVEYNAAICARPDGPDVLVAMLSPWQHLWSLKLGDLEPNQAVPPERFQATVNTQSYDFG